MQMELDISRVLLEDDYKTMANKIFYHFEVGQSCKVMGYLTDTGRVVEKGRAVLDHIEWLDKTENYLQNGKRKKIKPPDSIGGYVAQKIFKYKRTIFESQFRYTIWRMQ